MLSAAEPSPENIDEMRALLIAERALRADAEAKAAQAETKTAELESEAAALRIRIATLGELNERLAALLKEHRAAQFGPRSEKLDPDQLALGLEDIETAAAAIQQEWDKAAGSEAQQETEQEERVRTERLSLPKHLPVEKVVIELEAKTCACCGGALHVIGEEVSKRLDVVPAQLKIVETHRPKYGCRKCENAPVIAPAPPAIIPGGLPAEGLLAQIMVSRFADHLPLNRQSDIFERQGVILSRATLAGWVGRTAFELRPLYERLLEIIKSGDRAFCDETTARVLEPGRGRVKTGYFWAVARDARPYGGDDPPAVAYVYEPSRAKNAAREVMSGFSGVLQTDGYAGYNGLTEPGRNGGPVTLSYCLVHARRKFYKFAENNVSPIAEEALRWFAKFYEMEAEARGRPPEERCAIRQAKAAPLLPEFKTWLEKSLTQVSGKSKLADAIRYTLKRWDGLFLYLGDGRLEADNNIVENAIRPLALGRKNALFSGHDEGAANWARIASLIETCKLNDVNSQAWLEDVLKKIAGGWPSSKLDELLPFGYPKIKPTCQRATPEHSATQAA